MAATLRHQASLSGSGTAQSPTSSISSQNTTPTSPHFFHSQAAVPRYASTHPFAAALPSEGRSTPSLSAHPSRPPTPPLLHRPPQHATFASYLRSWGLNETNAFLALHRCGHYASNFQRNDIDGRVLLDLDMASLKEIGVAKVGERVKLLGGIKDLRKRAAAPSRSVLMDSYTGGTARVELRLNGASTPDPERLGPRSPDIRLPGERSIAQPYERSKRLDSSRPPPLDLHPHQSSRSLPQAIQDQQPREIASPPVLPSRQSLTPKAKIVQPTPSGTVTPANSVPGPSKSSPNLRAPPSREGVRQTPSPVVPDGSIFAERPLPAAPNPPQSSAAEYANSIAVQRKTPDLRGTPQDRRDVSGKLGSSTGRAIPLASVQADHRRQASLGTPSQISPIKSKFAQLVGGRPNTSGTQTHPFAANIAKDDQLSAGSSPYVLNRQFTGTFGPGSSDSLQAKSSSSDTRVRKDVVGQAQLPLEDIRRQVVKFTNHEDSSTRTVNVSACTSGVEVLEVVLKKFARWHLLDHSKIDDESDDDGEKLQIDGWGLYAESDPNEDDAPLSDASILAFCRSNHDGPGMREKGLVLKCKAKAQRRKNMEVFFGETPPPPMSPTSPTYMSGPRLGYQAPTPGQDPDLLTPSRAVRNNNKKMNRASMVSVMSGLGVQMPDAPPSPASTRSPSSGSFLGIKRKPFYNFLGHRPPSELIANHLVEYFPAAKRKELQKSRNSILRMSQAPNKRVSIAPSEKRGSSESERNSLVSPPRRRSVRPVSRIGIASPPHAPIPEEGESEILGDLPRDGTSTDGGKSGRGRTDGESSDTDRGPPLLPPFETSKESLSEQLGQFSPTPRPRPKSIMQGRRGSAGSSKSRVSMLSQMRRSRDRIDTASMLTVDEITATVEQRRASTITFDESSDDELLDVPPSLDPGLVPQNETEEGSEADEENLETESEESSDEDETDSEEDSEEDEHGRAYTSSGSRIFKWIKGALIGAGSFGSVFLGMDAQSGLLMAVKQVELPTGSAKHEERKRSMVDALEREIELLKELQHDNIVQYLDSSSDGNHLNIFLEYVPGGSVAALLNNYGAFEEPLVRNFCRQILTGLNYLHEREIIHRDIKGANILVDNKGGIKISDFGISKKAENNLMTGMRANRPSLQGSVFWMAPEIVKQTAYTSKADIWSVGCLVVEMLTGTHPWAELTQMQAIFRIGSPAPRPATPADISVEATDFLDRSFVIDHTARPTALELLGHSFIVPSKGGAMITAQQAKQTMAQATKTRDAIMGGMQGLNAMAEGR